MAAKCKYCNIVELDFEKLPDNTWKRTEKTTGTLHTPDRCKELKANPSLLSKLIAPHNKGYIEPSEPTITESKSTASAIEPIRANNLNNTTEILQAIKALSVQVQDMNNTVEVIAKKLGINLTPA